MSNKMTIKELRQGRSMTQRDLAGRVGVVVTTVKSWERGMKKPNEKNLIKLADIFNIWPDQIKLHDDESRNLSENS